MGQQDQGTRASMRRRGLVMGALVIFCIALVAGTSQAGPLDEGPLEGVAGEALPGGTAPPGKVDEALDADHAHCPPALKRAGVCKGHSHSDEPQDDFKPYSGTGKDTGETGKADRHGHSHSPPARSARRGATGSTIGKTTLKQTIKGTGDPDDGFQTLLRGPGEPRILREDLAQAKSGRAKRRRSLLYVGQTTDWQLVDEESPSRVEFLDIGANPPFPSTISAAWRPQEAFGPYAVDQAIRQLNAFAGSSPVKDRNGSRAEMDMVLMTGDQADNMQLNETDWVRTLLEGGTLDPNSGVDPSSCPAGLAPSGQTADPDLYAGVQDYDDYYEGLQFYDPDEPMGPKYADWPFYPGLMDRAQLPFQAQGLDVPSYVVFGNHDQLAQGNQKAILPFEQVGVGCVKPLVPATDLTDVASILDPVYLAGLAVSNPSQVMLVPPDPDRQYVDRVQYKDIFLSSSQADGHGFGLVDPAELTASNGAASYYSFKPKPGLRLIGIDTLCDAGVTGPSASGNVDDPQFQWLEQELEGAKQRDEIVVVFGHHPIRSLDCAAPDETPPPCTVDGSFGHDINAGCDIDPRNSSPVHDGGDLTELFHRFPQVVTYIAGHTHENTLSDFDQADARPGDFWGIETASLIDWPPQNRLIELMDNCDGTLSIFGTTIDTASRATAPAGVTINRERAARGAAPRGFADNLSDADLGSISRTLAYNDPQAGAGTGEGERSDRNVELLVDDPRRQAPPCARNGGNGGNGGDGELTDNETGGDAGPAASTGTGDGSLPFTGMFLLGLLVIGLVLATSGKVLRRLSRD